MDVLRLFSVQVPPQYSQVLESGLTTGNCTGLGYIDMYRYTHVAEPGDDEGLVGAAHLDADVETHDGRGQLVAASLVSPVCH